MSGNVQPNPGPIFPCSMYAGNVSSRSRSVQCYPCSEWVHLRCPLPFFSRFKTLDSSKSWIFPPCYVPASFGRPTPTNAASSSLDTSSLYTSTVPPGPSGPLCPRSAPASLSSSNLLPSIYPLRTFSLCTLPTP